MIMDNNHDTWQWQEPGAAWKGAGLYHVTLTVSDRQPLLGSLLIPDNDPKQARVEATIMGKALLDAMFSVQQYHREIQILHYCLMPDHLHAVWYVRHKMPKGIGSVAQGFWRAAKKIGRAYSYTTSRPNDSAHLPSFITPTVSRESYQENTLRQQIGDDAYYALSPIFRDMPHIRPMGQRRQLPATIRYIDMNPQRLATKRLMPGFFCVQEGIELAGHTYSGVGNIALLHAERYAPVHVRSVWIEDAEQHGDNTKLRDYMNGCVLAARQGAVMVSPFISKQEKMVQDVLLREHLPFILLADNGFRDYYKPADGIFDAVAEGRVLILSPWPYDAGKRHISRADCVALNTMAEEICNSSVPTSDRRENTKNNDEQECPMLRN